jgi:DNA-binding winged helix-turn-helix (wHTH) protein
VFDTLRVLVESAGRLVTKQELLDRVWPDTVVQDAHERRCRTPVLRL